MFLFYTDMQGDGKNIMGQEGNVGKLLEWNGLAHSRGCGLLIVAGMCLPVAGRQELILEQGGCKFQKACVSHTNDFIL